MLLSLVLAGCASEETPAEPPASSVPPAWLERVERVCALHPGEACTLSWSWLDAVSRGDCASAAARSRSVRSLLALTRHVGGDAEEDAEAMLAIQRAACPEEG